MKQQIILLMKILFLMMIIQNQYFQKLLNLQKNKVNDFYLKHPTSKDKNFFIKYNFPKLKIIDGHMPMRSL